MAKVKLFELNRQAILPRPFVEYLQSQGEPMHHSQGEVWVPATVKTEALQTLHEVAGEHWVRPAGQMRLGTGIYREALMAYANLELGIIYFAHRTFEGSPVYSVRQGEQPKLAGRFHSLPDRYGVRFERVKEGESL